MYKRGYTINLTSNVPKETPSAETKPPAGKEPVRSSLYARGSTLRSVHNITIAETIARPLRYWRKTGIEQGTI
jgi:hypothetical protein